MGRARLQHRRDVDPRGTRRGYLCRQPWYGGRRHRAERRPARARRRHRPARGEHLPCAARGRQGGLCRREPRARARVRQALRARSSVCRDRLYRRGRADERGGRLAAPGLLWRLPATALLCRPGTDHPVCPARGAGRPCRRAAAYLRARHPHIHHDGDAQRKEDRRGVLGQLRRPGRYVPRGGAGPHHAQDLPRGRALA